MFIPAILKYYGESSYLISWKPAVIAAIKKYNAELRYVTSFQAVSYPCHKKYNAELRYVTSFQAVSYPCQKKHADLRHLKFFQAGRSKKKYWIFYCFDRLYVTGRPQAS